MTFAGKEGLISNLKRFFGMFLTVLLLVSTVTLSKPKESEVVFEIAPGITAEESTLNAKITNNSKCAIEHRTIYIESLERKIDGKWKEIPSNKENLNIRNLVYSLFPSRFIFPSETWESSIKAESLFENGVYVPGDYRITFSYKALVGLEKTTYVFEDCLASCEFTLG